MRILITSDWQADYENLELCERAVEEILRLKEKHGFTVLVIAGDLKHQYNPIDVRVANFWIRAISRFKKMCMDVVLCMGNHDRVGMHVDKQNWFPILRKAGALAYDEPGFADVGDGRELAILPYTNNPVLFKRAAHDLGTAVADAKGLLIFHSDLANARYNVLTKSDGDGISVADLYPRKYLFCIGGHIHLQQNVAGNVWYVGSPFSTDWGEANQRKGYLLVDTREKTIEKISSRFPGWYDPEWPGFEEAKPKTWQGAKVRIKVKCEGVQHVREKLEAARLAAEKRYRGADISIVPNFVEEGDRGSGRIKASYPDEKKIRIYVQQTLPDELKNNREWVQKYLVEQLSQVGGLQRENGELRFRSFSAKNFLSYKELKAQFQPGLTIVTGQNKDWKGRSNGAGKSSYLQPLAVALFGQTFKDQKHDAWMRLGTDKKEDSYVMVRFDDAQGRTCLVKRARQPRELLLKVAGDIIENGNRPEGTQKLIEQVTGYTWQTLSNAIYIDQTKSHLMLTGTESDRKSFLARLQNLERFERAEKRVKEQKVEYERRYEVVSGELQSVLTDAESLGQSITDTRKILAVNESLEGIYKQAKTAYREKKERLDKWETNAQKMLKVQDNRRAKVLAIEKQYLETRTTVKTRLSDLEERLEGFRALKGTCHICFQIIDSKHLKKHIPETKEAISALEEQLEGYDEFKEKRQKKLDEIEEERDKWIRNKELAGEVSDLRDAMIQAKEQVIQLHQKQELLGKLKSRKKKLEDKAERWKEKKKKLVRYLTVLKYAQTVFQRSGLPAFLNAQICPALNMAAEEYSELFSQREIQVRFAVDEEGRLDVQVVNAHGGETIEAQSEGEMKIASLITSFAVRAAAPKTNLLILDEPGDGLDATSARIFARGLREVLSRFESVLLTTHNPAILSELSDARLSDARLVVVEKKNKVSEVVV